MHVIRFISTNSAQKFRNRLAVATLATSLALGATGSAMAQASRGGIASLFIPDFLPRDLPVFVDSLGLEEWQRPILEALLDDYQTNFATAADGVRASMGQLKDAAAGTSPDKIVDLISKPLVSWGEEKKKLRADFLESVKSQLSEVQVESWPRLERALLREKALPNGELSGESLDLVLIARETDAPPAVADAARAAIDDYELKLNQALAAREQVLEGTIASMLGAMGPNDMDKLQGIQQRIMQLRVAVREVQDASLAAIRDALGSEYGPKFEQRALRRAFPAVYGPDPVTPLFEAALALPDLSDDQKEKLAALRTTFTADHGSLQMRYADALRKSEPLERIRRMRDAQTKAAGGTVKSGDSAEIDAIKTERGDLYARYRAKLAEILTDQQKESVPGFGKPGADLAGQKYGDAVHLGTGGAAGGDGVRAPSKQGDSATAGEEKVDPAVKPSKNSSPTMNDTKTNEPKPAKSPKAE